MIGILAVDSTTAWGIAAGAVIFAGSAAIVAAWWEPAKRFVLRQEQQYDRVLRRQLLMDVRPRTVTLMGAGAILFFALVAYAMIQHVLVALAGAAFGAALPPLIVRFLRARRLYRLEDQLVDGIQTLSSGVRAGLNLVQSIGLLARNGVRPISEEFAHLVREYVQRYPSTSYTLNRLGDHVDRLDQRAGRRTLPLG